MATIETAESTAPETQSAAPRHPTHLKFGAVQQWMTLLGLVKYGFVFSVLLVFLPLAAIDVTPHHSLLGGLFIDLSPTAVLFVTIALVSAAWSVMYGVGLIVNGVELCFDRDGRACRTLPDIVNGATGFVPDWAEIFFTVPVTPPQLTFFTLLALPGVWAIVWHSTSPWLAAVTAALGLVVAYFGMIAACTPSALVDANHRPLAGIPLADAAWNALAASDGRVARGLRSISTLFRRSVSWVAWRLYIRYALDRAGGRLLYGTHLVAVVAFALLAAIILGMAGFLAPGAGLELPAVLYLYVIVLLLIWTVTTLHFYLGRHRLSILLGILLVIVAGYELLGADHVYEVQHQPLGLPVLTPATALTPVEVAAARGDGKTLVVVAASGGGILAAGWTTLVLEELVNHRPDLAKEIRLLSTISGGSVGAAYVIDALRTLDGGGDVRAAVRHARVRATTGSLEAAAYGFAFLDFPRLLTGGALPRHRNDRGHILEREWARTAEGRVAGDVVTKAPPRAAVAGTLTAPTLVSLRQPIRDGRIPAPIFGATIMESGQRVMVSPVDFAAIPRTRRAITLSELLVDTDARTDISLWTAARLSATFAFVSPAAKATLVAPVAKSPLIRSADHHLIDGGYYDNFGVTSALDWLEPVLMDRETSQTALRFERVLVLQLRAFRRGKPQEQQPEGGAYAALFGPLIGLGAIRDGVAASRNDIDLVRFVDAWNTRLAPRGVALCTMAIEPPPGPSGPLSWHLTERNKTELRAAWTRLVGQWNVTADIDAFLDPAKPPRCPEPPKL